jgi:transposase
VRFGKITVEQLAGKAKEEREKYPGETEMRVVQVKEKKKSGESGGKKEINWTLYTSHEVETREEALKAIEYYKSRWLIEDLFRTVKSEGMNYKVGELERAGHWGSCS